MAAALESDDMYSPKAAGSNQFSLNSNQLASLGYSISWRATFAKSSTHYTPIPYFREKNSQAWR